MRTPILSNRVAALAIVALTLAGVASLVGTDENEGALSTATQALAEKAAKSSDNGQVQQIAPAVQSSSPTVAPAAVAPPVVAGGFAEDESLIDDASGFDPSPDAGDPAQGEVVAIIEEDVADVSAAPVVIEEP